MKVKILGPYGGSMRNCRTTCFLVDDFLALDAGSLTLALDCEEQLKIHHIVLSHTHIDHIYSLPFFVANICSETKHTVTLYASKQSIENLQNHLFNNFTWPDFSILPSLTKPTIKFVEIKSEQPFQIKNYKITPIEVNHIIHTLGFLVSSEESSILYIADTSATDKIWEYANKTNNLKAIFIEASYPNRMRKLAFKSGHFTPVDLSSELQKLNHNVKILVYHFKPEFFEEIKGEVEEINHPNISFALQDDTHYF